MTIDHVTIQVGQGHAVSGLVQIPHKAVACCVLAHGAGAGMTHRFMASVADGFETRQVATLRFQFPYMETGSRRPDRPALAQAAVRAAVVAAGQIMPRLPLIAGGKSFGGRMTSQAQAEAPLPGVNGLVFFGFPLHAANKPSDERARHLTDGHIPMLFLQGDRNSLAEMRLLVPMIDKLGSRATLKRIDHADHSFHVPVRSGRTDDEVLGGMLDEAVSWLRRLLLPLPP